MVLRAKPEKVEERERTRLSLLRATLELATKHGYAGLGLREVARGATIAPTSFYRHFTDMEELGVALVDELVAPLLSDWRERSKVQLELARDPAEALVEQAQLTLEQDHDLMRFVLAERVGASVSCRRALRRELDQWALALSDERLPLYRSEAILSLLLESLSRSLEGEGLDDARREQVKRQVALLLGERARVQS